MNRPSSNDILERAEPWLQMCGACDAGLAMSCTCPAGDPRPIISDLVREIQRLRSAATETPAYDPTHGRIDQDIQLAVDEMRPKSVGQRVAIENTLQERRGCRGFVAAHGFGKGRTCRCGADYDDHPVRAQ